MSCKNPGVKHKCTCGVHQPPYEEDYLGAVTIRTFNKETTPPLGIGFMEEGDTWIEAINKNDWQVELEGEDPQSLEPKKIIQLPKGLSYRIIKGDSAFSLKITK